ncbi:lipin Ned1, partial [Kickxella alabastrina]
MRRPQEFKMACLRDIKNLFGDQSPFYAGFGNRITDAMSYRSVNVPVSRICTIDTYGEIKLDLLPGYKSSYVKINDLVDMMFPALSSKLDPKYNDWEYWKPKMPEIDDELAEIDAMLTLEANAAANKSKPSVNAKGTVPAAVATALSLPSAARRTSISSPSYMVPRTSRAQSSIGSPAQNQRSPLSHAGGHRHHQQDLALGTPALSDTAVRQRADSWASSTQTALPPNVSDSSQADAKGAADGLHVEAAPAADTDTANDNNSNISGGHLNLLKKASSALSPFNLVRGSSPLPPPQPSSLPSAIASTPSGSDLSRVADGECTSISDK